MMQTPENLGAMPIRRGFTLIELLVVLAILGMLFGLTFLTTGKQQRGATVRQEAELLAATLRQARSMAMSRRSMYAVVFNIQNAPGSSGAILNNRSGGHWYRILGPAPTLGTRQGATSDMTDRIPYGGGGSSLFPTYVREIRDAWVGDAHVLPAKRVRFLALSDTDEGPAWRDDTPNYAKTVRYGSGGETTYPRPWFGYFDETTKTLWPWGGYDPTKSTSAFWYQGNDPAIVGSVNPVDNLYRTAGEPRPVVNADWGDYGIAFFPDGRAQSFEWNRGRRIYKDAVQDMCKVHIKYTRENTYTNEAIFTAKDGPTTTYLGPYGARDVLGDIPEVAHFVKHTGGWHITLAPDVLTDTTEFPSAEAALASLTPMHRVFIGRNGTVEVLYVREAKYYLDGKNPWPANPTDWLDTATTGSNSVWKNCRVGWLHAVDSGSDPSKLIPRGRPIVDVIEPRMLSRRQWWLDD